MFKLASLVIKPADLTSKSVCLVMHLKATYGAVHLNTTTFVYPKKRSTRQIFDSFKID
jgi:hypothetical protein